jgi:hypothetical protein
MLRALDRKLARIASRRGLAMGLVAAVAFLCSALPYLYYSRSTTPFSSWSFFTTYDEYSYLLAADTYASGRLTNPTHPLWEHFDTLSVNHRPTYQSMYPPGQALFLAAGQVLTGHPIVGVWISMALACAAVCYLLQAWFPPRWALLGGLLAALHPRMALEWGGTYFGGAVAMLGAALVFGGLRNVVRRPRATSSCLLALGLALLANARPYEGLVASVPALAVLVKWVVFDTWFSGGTRIARVAAPMAAILAAAAACMAYYNLRVAQDPWTLPYQIYLADHGRETPFVWQSHREGPGVAFSSVENGAPRLQDGEGDGQGAAKMPGRPLEEWWFATDYLSLLTHPSPFVSLSFKLAVQWAFYVGPLLTVPLLALFWGPCDRWMGFAVLTSVLTLLAVLMTHGAWPHYFAPAAPLVFVLAVQGSRSLGLARRRGRRIGRTLVPTLLVVSAAWLILVVGLFPQVMRGLRWAESRTELVAQLERMDGDHLVVVRYRKGHVWYKEWVYNKADIDRAKIVWARELTPDSNRGLLDYFKGRRVWLLEADREPPTLLPYPYTSSTAAVPSLP